MSKNNTQKVSKVTKANAGVAAKVLSFKYPTIIDPTDSPDTPGICIRPKVKGKELDELFWQAPDWIKERDWKARLKTVNCKKMFEEIRQDHLIVIIGRLAEAPYQRWLLDGHTRRGFWKSNDKKVNPKQVCPDELVVIEHVAKTMEELSDIYYHYNSNDSVESTDEIIKAVIDKHKFIDDATGEEWIPLTTSCKKGQIAGVLNYACIFQDWEDVDGNEVEYASAKTRGTWSVAAKGNRSKSLVRNDLLEQQLVARHKDLIMMDRIVDDAEKQTLFDPTMKAALMIVIKAYGHTIPSNLQEALDKYIGKNEKIKNEEGIADMTWNLNRLIRDARPMPKEVGTDIQSHHHQYGMRNKRKGAQYCVQDTVWNLKCIIEHGVTADLDAYEDDLNSHIEDWIKKARVSPYKSY